MSDQFVYIAGVQRGGTTLMQCEVASILGAVCIGEAYQTVGGLIGYEPAYRKLLALVFKRLKKRWNSENFNQIRKRVLDDALWHQALKTLDVGGGRGHGDLAYREIIEFFDENIKEAIVDSSKHVKGLSAFKKANLKKNKKIILITRDVKPWVDSVNKYEIRDRGINFSEQELLKRWKRRINDIVAAVEESGLPYFRIHLEKYVKNPSAYRKQLCEFLEVDGFKNELQYHDILGNHNIKKTIELTGKIEIDYDWSWQPYKKEDIPKDVFELNEILYEKG